MDLSVVIVNYKVPDYIYQCLNSIKKATEKFDTEIFVVDNASNDNSVEFLKKYHPDVIFIENEENLGFSKANNMAISKAKGEFVLIINPDTFVAENMVDDCVDFMRKHDDCGAIGVMMHSANGTYAPESKRGVPRPFTAFCKMIGLCKRFPKNKVFGRYYLGHLDKNEVNEIEILSGACMFMRHATIDKVGMFDVDYFMYGEDVDLSYRVLKGGYKNYYLPTKIVHYKGESANKLSYSYVNNFNKSMAIFFRKHFSKYSWLFEIPIISAVYLKAACGYLKVWLYKVLGLMSYSNDNDFKTKYLVFTDNSENDPAAKLLKECGLQVNTRVIDEDVMAKGHNILENQGDDYDYVVYNTNRFDYKDIIEFFTSDEKKQKHVEMAIYHPEVNKIITAHKIISADNS